MNDKMVVHIEDGIWEESDAVRVVNFKYFIPYFGNKRCEIYGTVTLEVDNKIYKRDFDFANPRTYRINGKQIKLVKVDARHYSLKLKAVVKRKRV